MPESTGQRSGTDTSMSEREGFVANNSPGIPLLDSRGMLEVRDRWFQAVAAAETIDRRTERFLRRFVCVLYGWCGCGCCDAFFLASIWEDWNTILNRAQHIAGCQTHIIDPELEMDRKPPRPNSYGQMD